MRVLIRSALVMAAVMAGIACDQISKAAAREWLVGSGVQSFLGDSFRLQFAQNPGAFLSLGESLPAAVRFDGFIIGVGLGVIALLAWAVLAPALRWSQRFAIAAICAGGAGNLIDRIRFDGAVTDFLNLGIGPVRTGIFNVADVVLLCGAIALLSGWNRYRPTSKLTA